MERLLDKVREGRRFRSGSSHVLTIPESTIFFSRNFILHLLFRGFLKLFFLFTEYPDSAISISSVPDLVRFFLKKHNNFQKNSNSAVSWGPKNRTNRGLPP